ncbi:MAG: hypothetical protein P4L84_30845 [Isosphaeraceae bacterium]|nr:hypothetical protein [Isosphaeraceae bacterium]
MTTSGSSRSLGGYGASAGPSIGSSGAGYLPYMGNASGFVPYSGGRVGVQPIPRRLSTTSIGGSMMAGTPIGGGSVRAMGGGRGNMAAGADTGRRSLLPFGYEGGIGMGATSMRSPSGMSARRPYGPGFGYPFTMPSVLSGSTSMSMP